MRLDVRWCGILLHQVIRCWRMGTDNGPFSSLRLRLSCRSFEGLPLQMDPNTAGCIYCCIRISLEPLAEPQGARKKCTVYTVPIPCPYLQCRSITLSMLPATRMSFLKKKLKYSFQRDLGQPFSSCICPTGGEGYLRSCRPSHRAKALVLPPRFRQALQTRR